MNGSVYGLSAERLHDANGGKEFHRFTHFGDFF